jgi:hypothetical protein
MFPDDDKLARGDKEPFPATDLLPLLPATAPDLFGRAEKLFGLTPRQTQKLLYELRRDKLVIQTPDGTYLSVRIEK